MSVAQGGINALISLKLMTSHHLTGVERRRAHPTTDAHRDRATGNHLPRRLLLWIPRVRAHPKEQARGDGVSCGVGGGERGGGRSSGTHSSPPPCSASPQDSVATRSSSSRAPKRRVRACSYSGRRGSARRRHLRPSQLLLLPPLDARERQQSVGANPASNRGL